MSDSPDPAQAQVQVQAHVHDGDRLLMERVLLFCDAVYAIVITLLALEIRLPEHGGEGGWSDAALLQALCELAPKFMGYFISFAVIALLWLGHLRRYRLLRAVDARSAALLLVQLAFVGLLPFFTSLLAEAPTRTAIVMYAGNLVVAAAAGLALGATRASCRLARART